MDSIYQDLKNSSDSDISTNFNHSDISFISQKFSPDVKIPKIIMQTWKNKYIPQKWKNSPNSISKHMPDWKYVLMTDADNRKFVQTHFPDFLSYYDSFPYNIQRADAIRYMWLYIHGGIYIDLDYEILQPLDELFIPDAQAYFVNSGNVGSYITNSFMASKPKCPLWLEVIEIMKQQLPWYYLGKHFQVMNTTGPIMLTYAASRSSVSYLMLPRLKITPCSVCNIFCKARDTYVKQLQGSSWTSYDTKLYIYFMCNWRYICLLIFILFIIIVLWLLYKWYTF